MHSTARAALFGPPPAPAGGGGGGGSGGAAAPPLDDRAFDCVTLSGYLCAVHGEIPAVGVAVVDSGYRFTVARSFMALGSKVAGPVRTIAVPKAGASPRKQTARVVGIRTVPPIPELTNPPFDCHPRTHGCGDQFCPFALGRGAALRGNSVRH